MFGEEAIKETIERIILLSELAENGCDDGWYNGPEGPDWDNSIE